MARQWKEMRLTRYQGNSEELGGLVFVLCAALITLSLFAAIIFFCADGVSKNSTKASTPNNYGHGSTCTAGCGAGCGG